MIQRIPITNPCRVVVTLNDYGKKAGAYQFSKSLKPFLTPRGWQVAKETRDYVHLTPSAGVTKPFRLTLDVPDRAQVKKLAAERHAVGEQWVGWLGNWHAYYVPFHKDGVKNTPYDLFTGEQVGSTETTSTPARFHVGTIHLWTEWIVFGEAGPVYYDQTTDPNPATVQPDLFTAVPNLAPTASQVGDDQDDTDDLDAAAFPEGRVSYRQHRLRERNGAVIDLAKSQAKIKHGRLACCVCDFDFAAMYGPVGEDFIEGHHTKPVSELEEGATTKVSDIALVCANCHRMLHRKRPWLGVHDLQSLLAKKP